MVSSDFRRCSLKRMRPANSTSIARGVTNRWVKPEGKLDWDFDYFKPGTYNVVLVTTETRAIRGGDAWEGGHVVKIKVGGNELTGHVDKGEHVKNERNPRWKDVRTTVGQIKLGNASKATLSLQAEKITATNNLGLTLRSVELVPVK